jgi:hypothetical protein
MGQIVSAWDPRVTNRDPFREFLLRRDFVPREALSRVLKTETRSPHSFAEILLRLRVLTHDELSEAFAEHIQEKIEELVSWTRGTFEFLPQDTVVRYTPQMSLKTEGLLMEAVRRNDEGAATRVRSESVLHRAPMETEPMLSPAAEAMLALVDGRKSFAAITAACSIERQEAIVAAEELLENGCVTIGPGPVRAPEAAAPARASSAAVLAHAAILGAVLLGSVVGHRLIAERPAIYAENPVAEITTRVFQIQEERSLVALRVALDFSRHRNGRYPERLDALLEDGLLQASDIRFLRDRKLVYYTVDDGKGYRLEPNESASVVRRPKL